ncbi:MAG TPA: metalloregulator ArsR/SmtB family transcription factor [Thermomicrobiales bacterium]|nr:metalloregulator ArsR/SmtB family transcription factor [Thermomicrobiales bacterium]
MSRPATTPPAETPRAANRLLMELKMRGERTTADLSRSLGITSEAVRQQMTRLAEQHLVTSRSVPCGVGRPAQTWCLTETGNARFPDTHAQLTVDLICAVRTELGDAAIDAVIAGRERDTLANYKREMAGVDDTEGRVARLAAIRTREGYMAEWSHASDGSLLLVENHCPICAAAASCQNFCRTELAIFQQVLGDDVTVERQEHILSGARRCAYRITPSFGS